MTADDDTEVEEEDGIGECDGASEDFEDEIGRGSWEGEAKCAGRTRPSRCETFSGDRSSLLLTRGELDGAGAGELVVDSEGKEGEMGRGVELTFGCVRFGVENLSSQPSEVITTTCAEDPPPEVEGSRTGRASSCDSRSSLSF